MKPAVFNPARRSRSRCSIIRRINAWVPVMKTLPLARVYLSSREALARSVIDRLLAQSLDSRTRFDSRLRSALRAVRTVRSAVPTVRSAVPTVRSAVPIRFGTERFGEEVDEHAGLGGQVAPVRIDRPDGHVARKGVARKERHERSLLEVAAHIPGRFQGDAESGERPVAQDFPVVAR